MQFGRRRRYIVDKRLQVGFVLRCLAYMICFLLMVAVALFLPLAVTLYGSDEGYREMTRVADQILYLHGSFWPAVSVSVFLLCLHALLTSHKFAGPLYRHKKIYKEIANGEIPKDFRSREGDYLANETAGLNEMVTSLRVRVADIQQEELRLADALSRATIAARGGSMKEVKEQITSVAEIEAQLSSKIKHFRVQT